MNNQAVLVMIGNMAKRICISRMNNQYYLCITGTLCIINATIQG